MCTRRSRVTCREIKSFLHLRGYGAGPGACLLASNTGICAWFGRIRKMPAATESVDAIKATVAVGLDGASRLKLRKMSMNQQITTMSIGLENGGHRLGSQHSSGAVEIP